MFAKPSGETADLIADWLELTAFTEESQSISKASAIADLQTAGVENAKVRVNSAWRELRSRQSILRDLYPFDVEEESVLLRKDPKDWTTYGFLMFVSAAMRSSQVPKPCTPAQTKSLSKAFEHLTVHAIESRFCEGVILNIGDRRDPNLPADFEEMLKEIVRQSKEPRGVDPVAARAGDGGADIVSWYPIGDQRPGQLFLIAQCTIGDDLAGASEEISDRTWNGYIHTYVPKVKVISFPYSFTNYGTLEKTWEDWSKATQSILLDRIRIVLASARKPLSPTLEAELGGWMEQLKGGFVQIS